MVPAQTYYPWSMPKMQKSILEPDGSFDQKYAERFLAKIRKTESCWLIDSCISVYGYVTVRIPGKRVMQAHRISWEIHNGAIPDGLFVLHRCDVRNCVNPDHLFLGTKLDNALDKVAKGRQAKGSGDGNSKMKESHVLAMREAFRNGGYTTHELAALYGMSLSHTQKICYGHSWKHLLNHPDADTCRV